MESVFSIERMIKGVISKGDDPSCLYEEYSRAMIEAGFKFPEDGNFRNIVEGFDISLDTISIPASCIEDDLMDGGCNISDGFDFSIIYVGRLIGVDLSRVGIFKYKYFGASTEGRAHACAKDEHFVLVSALNGFISEDLLVHEVAHAAEFIVRRSSGDVGNFNNYRVLSEAVAHYCQLKYLYECSSCSNRAGVVGSFTLAHFYLRCCRAAADIGSSVIEPSSIYAHRYLSDYVSVYGEGRVYRLIGNHNGWNVEDLYRIIVEPRFGFLVALKLIRGGFDISLICSAPILDTISETLDGCGIPSCEVLDFSDADCLIDDFVRGSFRTENPDWSALNCFR